MKPGRPKGSKDGAGARPADEFAIRREPSRSCWMVRQGAGPWRRAREVFVMAPVLMRPNGDMVGRGCVVEQGDGSIVVNA